MYWLSYDKSPMVGTTSIEKKKIFYQKVIKDSHVYGNSITWYRLMVIIQDYYSYNSIVMLKTVYIL